MTTSHDDQPATPGDAAPLNRAERRAMRKGKGKGASTPTPTLHQKDQRRSSQVVAQPKYRGKRGDK